MGLLRKKKVWQSKLLDKSSFKASSHTTLLEIQKHVADYLVAQNPVPQNPAPQSWKDEGSYVWEYEHRKGLSFKGNHQRNVPHLGPLIVAGAGAGGLVGGPVGAAVGTAIVCTAATIQKVSGDVKTVLLAREVRKAAVDMAKTGERGHQVTNNSQCTALSRTQEDRRRNARHAPITQSGRKQLSDRGNQRQIAYDQSSEDDSDDSGSGQSNRRQLSDRGNQRRLVYHQSSEDDSDDWGSRHSDRRQLSGRGNQRRH